MNNFLIAHSHSTKSSVLERPVIFRELERQIPSTTYATFGLYRYPAKFIPQVISYALKTYAQQGMSVLDPFAGYGTVGTVARLHSNHYELWDLNPLLKHLHPISIMKPVEIDAETLVQRMSQFRRSFIPDWTNIAHWYPEECLPLFQRAWGFYHFLDDLRAKRLLLIPLIKATRYFSYNDAQRQKLSRSRRSCARVNSLLQHDWQSIFFKRVRNEVEDVQKKIQEYKALNPKPVDGIVKAGVDCLTLVPEGKYDILLTSPPYLQAQEYIRASKMDLFWLGYTQDRIRTLGQKEIPYQKVEPRIIHSTTYLRYLDKIAETHMQNVYQRYFYGVLGSLTRVQEFIRQRLLLFVGPATVRGIPIPIDKIFIEHFSHLGWHHEETLIDSIVARGMFFYKENPATGIKDKRMSTEHLVVLSRRK